MDVQPICNTINAKLKTDLHKLDFIKPETGRTQALYRLFLVEVCGIQEDFLGDGDETMVRAAPVMLLYKHMKIFVTNLAVAVDLQFAMCDLIQPPPPRFRLLAQLLADYITFIQTSNPEWDKMNIHHKKQHEHLKQLQTALRQAQKERESVSTEVKLKKQEEEKLLTELADKQNDVRDAFNQVDVAERQLGLNDVMMEDGNSKLEEIKKEMESLEFQLAFASNEILASPDRVQKEAVEMRQKVLLCEQQINSAKQIHKDIAVNLALAPSITHVITHLEDSVLESLARHKNAIKTKENALWEQDSAVFLLNEKLVRMGENMKEVTIEENEHEDIRKKKEKESAAVLAELAGRRTALEREVKAVKKSMSSQGMDASYHNEIIAIRSEKIEKMAMIRHEMESLFENYKAYMDIYEEKKKELTVDIVRWNEEVAQIEKEL